MQNIILSQLCGQEILSRINISKIYQIDLTNVVSLDFTDVSFISRSVADELCNFNEQHPDVSFENLCSNVEEMLHIVKSSRCRPRQLKAQPQVSVKYNCRTLDDLRKALSYGA